MQFKEQKLFFNTHTNSVNLLTKEKYENLLIFRILLMFIIVFLQLSLKLIIILLFMVKNLTAHQKLIFFILTLPLLHIIALQIINFCLVQIMSMIHNVFYLNSILLIIKLNLLVMVVGLLLNLVASKNLNVVH